MKEKIFIILVNYNGSKDTLECIESLKEIYYRNVEIIVVDNNSKKEEIDLLKEKEKDFILIETNKNNGFAIGNNIGVKYAIDNGADYVLLLNNDTIVEKDFLNIMLETYKSNDNVGAVGCRIMYHSDRRLIWYNGGKIDYSKFSAFNIDEKKLDKDIVEQNIETDFITGCCILIPKNTIKNIGYLSDEYFMYYEDVDYSLRIKERGLNLIINPKSKIYHKVSISSGGEDSPFRIFYSNRARKIFMNKFGYKVSRGKFLRAKIYFIITRLLKIFKFILRKENLQAKALWSVMLNRDYL